MLMPLPIYTTLLSYDYYLESAIKTKLIITQFTSIPGKLNRWQNLCPVKVKRKVIVNKKEGKRNWIHSQTKNLHKELDRVHNKTHYNFVVKDCSADWKKVFRVYFLYSP